MTLTLIRGDAQALPLPDASADLIVTSPPYWSLRSYTDGGRHYDGQIGAEPTPGAYIDNLIACTAEWARVLKPTGSIWVNLGDKYATRYASTRSAGRAGLNGDDETRARTGQNRTGAPEKSLLGLPWRYALRCIDDLGLTLRAEIIWSKSNGLPESVTDRVRRSHETWFHLTRSARYYAAVDTIREAHVSGHTGLAATFKRPKSSHDLVPGHSAKQQRDDVPAAHPLGKLPGSVWTVATQPLKVPAELGIDHFAAFPMAWPRRIISGWSPVEVCTACGQGRTPAGVCGCNAPILTPAGSGERLPDPSVTHGKAGFKRPRRAVEAVTASTRWEQRHHAQQIASSPHRALMQAELDRPLDHYRKTSASSGRPLPADVREQWIARGWLTPAPPFTPPAARPAVVLDPFGGTGTTALVADVLGRHGISVDMSADYLRLARWRCTDPRQRARAAATATTARRPRAGAGQPPLFG